MKPALGKIFSLLNLHLLVLVLLAALNLFFCVRLIGAWHTLHAAAPEQVQQAQTSYRVLNLQMRPLRDLPKKVDEARAQAGEFYDQRFPSEYSTISAAFYDLAGKNNIRVSHLSYVPEPAIPGLAQIRMDASMSGQYAPLMHFINGLERSRTFFLINDLTLTGQQGGLVNLRLRLTTYMRASDFERTAPAAGDQTNSATGLAPAPANAARNLAQNAGPRMAPAQNSGVGGGR
jgi:hypothetical protein